MKVVNESESDEDDYFDEVPERMKNKFGEGRGARKSVSAEAYGKFNQKALFIPKVGVYEWKGGAEVRRTEEEDRKTVQQFIYVQQFGTQREEDSHRCDERSEGFEGAERN